MPLLYFQAGRLSLSKIANLKQTVASNKCLGRYKRYETSSSCIRSPHQRGRHYKMAFEKLEMG